jgi:hypothetical protein
MCCLGAIYSMLTCGEDKDVAFVRNNKPTKVITPEHQIGTELRRSHNAEVMALYPSPPNNKLIGGDSVVHVLCTTGPNLRNVRRLVTLTTQCLVLHDYTFG